MSIHVKKKKLEKENCNVHIDSDTCYSKDLMRGLRPVVLALSLPPLPVFPLCFSLLLCCFACGGGIVHSAFLGPQKRKFCGWFRRLSLPSPFKELDTCLPFCTVQIMSKWMCSLGHLGKESEFHFLLCPFRYEDEKRSLGFS